MPAVSGRPEKKVFWMTPVRLPKTKKSYHSKVVPADGGGDDRARGWRPSTGAAASSAAISAMALSSPRESAGKA